MEGEHPLILSPGQPVVIHYRDNRGRFAAVARVEPRRDGLPNVVVAVERVDRLQRRDYFRWAGTVDARYLVLADGEEVNLASALRQPGWKASRTIDLSGGGLCLHMVEPVDLGARVMLDIRLPGQKEPVYAEGSVVRMEEEAQARPARYQAGVQFTRIAESARSRVMAFVFSQEVRFKRF